ncbi:ABC transporter ATP-binding protein [Rhodopseudomonas palustris]|uniref:ATP-binding cassette domain-containing protein n=1 Tax=Rhodopseudomonas palustris TaxID=1076 RepID=UPI0024BF9C02|nr:ABC transporter ATP-binding protein [Rhodopseudomonas palustris]
MTGRLVLDDVAIGYDGQPLAEGIDLVLSGSSTTCLMGPNGVGKTTLFKAVLGIVPPLRGRIMIGGDDIATLRPEQIARRIAHVPQAYQGDPSHSVIDIVVMGRTARLGIFAAQAATTMRRPGARWSRSALPISPTDPPTAFRGGSDN